MTEIAGITPAGTGFEDVTWNILGQVYHPKQSTEDCFSFVANSPPGTFVPPHIHPTQDEYILMLEGEWKLILDGQTHFAKPGDLVRINAGPLAQRIAQVQSLSPDGRVSVLFDMLGCSNAVDLDLAALSPVF